MTAGNLGVGRGVNVPQLLHALARATGRTLPYAIGAPRPGDIAESWTDPAAAARQLGWRASPSIDQARADRWRWQRQSAERLSAMNPIRHRARAGGRPGRPT